MNILTPKFQPQKAKPAAEGSRQGCIKGAFTGEGGREARKGAEPAGAGVPEWAARAWEGLPGPWDCVRGSVQTAPTGSQPALGRDSPRRASSLLRSRAGVQTSGSGQDGSPGAGEGRHSGGGR